MTSRKRRYLLAALLLLALVLMTWLFWPDPRMAKATELRNQLFGPAAKMLSDQERRQKMQEYRDLTKGMSSSQRRQLSSLGRRDKQREISRYFTLSPGEKRTFLDNEIRRQGTGRQGNAGGAQGKRGPGPSGGAGSTPQDRDKRRQGFLDNSSPAERAQMSRYMHDLNARRAQLGLPQRGPGGR